MNILFLLLCYLNKNKKEPTPFVKNDFNVQEIAEIKKERKKIQVIVNCDQNNLQKDDLVSIGTLKYDLPMIHAYVLEIFEDQLFMLEGVKGVVKVEQDAHLTAQMDTARQTVRASWVKEMSNNGKGVTVAVLDTGVYPHRDLTEGGNRVIAFQDFVNGIKFPYDDHGHGTHVAGIIAGSGFESKGRYLGIAPLAYIIGVKVLSKDGSGNISDVLAGLQWVLDNKEKYNIKIINLSVGMEDFEGENAALVKGVDVAWDQGIIVVCAAGNNGPSRGSVTTPGVSRKVITVGSSDDINTVSIMNDLISDYSGRGPTKSCIKKPDIVAPGSNIVSCFCDTDFLPKNDEIPSDEIGYIKKSGTSMSTPIVSGILARLISDFPDLSNKDIKLALKYTTNDLGFKWEHQGWGLIDLQKLYNYFAAKPVE